MDPSRCHITDRRHGRLTSCTIGWRQEDLQRFRHSADCEDGAAGAADSDSFNADMGSDTKAEGTALTDVGVRITALSDAAADITAAAQAATGLRDSSERQDLTNAERLAVLAARGLQLNQASPSCAAADILRLSGTDGDGGDAGGAIPVPQGAPAIRQRYPQLFNRFEPKTEDMNPRF